MLSFSPTKSYIVRYKLKYLHVLRFILMFDFLIRRFKIWKSNLLTFESWLSERNKYPHLFIVYPTFLRWFPITLTHSVYNDSSLLLCLSCSTTPCLLYPPLQWDTWEYHVREKYIYYIGYLTIIVNNFIILSLYQSYPFVW